MARLVPCDDQPPPLFGALAGWAIEVGDIVSPLDEEWDALK